MDNFFAMFSPLQRFYRFVFKKLLGRFLRDDLQLQQLDVQLGSGCIELKDLELNCDVRPSHPTLVVVAQSGTR